MNLVPSPVKVFAEEKGLKVLQPEKVKNNEEFMKLEQLQFEKRTNDNHQMNQNNVNQSKPKVQQLTLFPNQNNQNITKSNDKTKSEGNISPDKLSGGSFTVSNLGSFGVESFQLCTLRVGSAPPRLRCRQD